MMRVFEIIGYIAACVALLIVILSRFILLLIILLIRAFIFLFKLIKNWREPKKNLKEVSRLYNTLVVEALKKARALNNRKRLLWRRLQRRLQKQNLPVLENPAHPPIETNEKVKTGSISREKRIQQLREKLEKEREENEKLSNAARITETITKPAPSIPQPTPRKQTPLQRLQLETRMYKSPNTSAENLASPPKAKALGSSHLIKIIDIELPKEAQTNEITSKNDLKVAPPFPTVYSVAKNTNLSISPPLEKANTQTETVKLKTPPSISKPFELDDEAIKQYELETQSVQNMLSAIFEDDESETAPPLALESNNGIDQQHYDLFKRLIQQEQWSRDDFISLCRSLNLMPDGALETINDWSFDKTDEAVLEDDGDIIYIVEEIVIKIKD